MVFAMYTVFVFESSKDEISVFESRKEAFGAANAALHNARIRNVSARIFISDGKLFIGQTITRKTMVKNAR